MISKEELGKLIKAARETKSKEIAKRYTQKMLADDIRKSQGYIGDIESGRTYPTLVVLGDIAVACGVPLSFFSDIEKQIDEYVEVKLGDYPAETQEMVKNYIRTGNERLDFLGGQKQHDITLEGFPRDKEANAAYSKKDLQEASSVLAL